MLSNSRSEKEGPRKKYFEKIKNKIANGNKAKGNERYSFPTSIKDL